MSDERVKARASEAPPEERSAGTDEREGQAAAILAESDLRQEDREAAPASVVEHRRSEETVDPPSTT